MVVQQLAPICVGGTGPRGRSWIEIQPCIVYVNKHQRITAAAILHLTTVKCNVQVVAKRRIRHSSMQTVLSSQLQSTIDAGVT